MVAYHEQHERTCSACGVRISAAAPECPNCGEFVDDDDEDEQNNERERRPTPVEVLTGIFVTIVLVTLGILAYMLT